jgi:hypothetical protein
VSKKTVALIGEAQGVVDYTCDRERQVRVIVTSPSLLDYLTSFTHLKPRSISAEFGSKCVRLAALKTTLSES